MHYHHSPIVNPEDLDIDIHHDIEYENMQYDEEEKQSSPTQTQTVSDKAKHLGINNINTSSPSDNRHNDNNNNVFAVTPSTLYHLTADLNINDLPLRIDDTNINSDYEDSKSDSNTKHSLSELFVGGGKRYWQNVKKMANVQGNGFYEANSQFGNLSSIFNDDEQIDFAAMGLQVEPPTNSQQQDKSNYLYAKTNKLNDISSSPMTPDTPQPRPSQLLRNLNSLNKQTLSSLTDPYQNAGKSSSDNNSNIDQDEDDDDDDSKYGDYADNYNPNGLPSSTKTSGVVIPDNVPFAIAALFDNMTDPNPITMITSDHLINDNKIKAINEENEEKEDIRSRTPPSLPPVLVSMQSFKENENMTNTESIEARFKRAQRNASEPEIILPGSLQSNQSNTNRSITMYEPNTNRSDESGSNQREKSISPDSNNKNGKNPKSPSPDDQALKIDYQLETVAKSKFVRRLSFPLGKIDEHPQLEIAATASPISPIDDHPFAMDFGSKIDGDDDHDYNNNNDQKDVDEENKNKEIENENENDNDIENENDDKRSSGLSADKESVISDLETDEKKDELQSDDDDDNDIDDQLQIDRDHDDNIDIINIDDDGRGGTGTINSGGNKGRDNRGYRDIQEHYMFDEPSQPFNPSQSENEESNSLNFVLFDSEQKNMEQEDGDDLLQTAKDNEIRLKAANFKIDNLEKEISEIKDENDRLAVTKMDLLDKTSQQMEEMRDELQNMCQQLVAKEQTIKQLIHISKEGYNPDDDHKSDTNNNNAINTRSSWSNPLGIGNSIKNGLWTFGRSKFSSPIHTLTDTKKSKIDLAISTSSEIERLRSIIKVLSAQKTLTGGGGGGGAATQQQNGLINGTYNGLYPGSY